jgi:hypothetical protein
MIIYNIIIRRKEYESTKVGVVLVQIILLFKDSAKNTRDNAQKDNKKIKKHLMKKFIMLSEMLKTILLRKLFKRVE